MNNHIIVSKEIKREDGTIKTYYNIAPWVMNDLGHRTVLAAMFDWCDSPEACIGALELIKASCIQNFNYIARIG